MVCRREDDVGAGDAEQRAEERERAGGGRRQRAADTGAWRPSRSGCEGRRRSRCGSARPSARGCRAPRGRPRRRDRHRAGAGARFVVGPRSRSRRPRRARGRQRSGRSSMASRDSTSQPAGICFQPWRRRPSRVMNVGFCAGSQSPHGLPKRRRPVSTRWTLVTANASSSASSGDDRAGRSGRWDRPGSPCPDRPWPGSMPRYLRTAGVRDVELRFRAPQAPVDSPREVDRRAHPGIADDQRGLARLEGLVEGDHGRPLERAGEL